MTPPLAAEYSEFGPAEVLDVVDVPDVHAGPGEVRIRVKAVGLNPYDFKMLRGSIPLADPEFPRGIGGDVAGVVDEVGAGASFTTGDEVFGWGLGTAREQLVVASEQLTLKPSGLPWEVAASFSTPVQTAHFSMETLKPGEGDVVLVSAAAGAVGFVYSQLVIARGARVIGTASESNFALLRSIGVQPVAYGPGLADRVRALNAGSITAVQDNFGRETIDAGVQLGVPAYRICSIVDHAAVIELGLVSPGRFEKSAEVLAHYARSAAAGDLVLPIQAVYPLASIRDAFAVLEGRHLSGKIVIAL